MLVDSVEKELALLIGNHLLLLEGLEAAADFVQLFLDRVYFQGKIEVLSVHFDGVGSQLVVLFLGDLKFLTKLVIAQGDATKRSRSGPSRCNLGVSLSAK